MKKIREWIQSFWPKRIWQQIAIVLVFLTAVPLLILGALLIATSQEAVRVSVSRDNGELAVLAAGKVSEFVQKPRELLGTVAAIVGISHKDTWQQETAIVELSLRYPQFTRIASVDLEGKEVAISRLGGQKREWRGDKAFEEARSGREYMSSVQLVGRDTPVVTLAAPIISMGQISGVLVAEVDLRGMWSLVDSIRVGKTGYACVIDCSGVTIAHPDKKVVLNKQLFFDSHIAARVLRGEAGSRENRDAEGRRWLTSYASINNTCWGLIFSQSADEAFAFSRIMLVQAWFFILLAIGVAVVTSMALADFMSAPMNALLEGARRIARKEYDSPVPVERNDEVGQVMQSFNAMTAQLKKAQQEEKLSVIGRAATAIAHELRNSLVLVDTYIQLLGEHYQEKEFVRDFIQVVPRELSAWKGMLKNMVDYARVTRFNTELLDLNVLVKDVAVLAKARIGQYDINLVVETTAKAQMIRGNADKLRQVILNLVSNAIDSTPPQGTIRLATVQRGGVPPPEGRAVVIVENTGPAIPADKLEKIFEPFFTTKDGGLGLGLPICKEIVERHDGSITVFSQSGEGTSFQVSLPQEKGGSDVL